MSPQVLRGTFTAKRNRLRLDKAVADHFGCGRRAVRDLFRTARVTIDGRLVPASYLLSSGERVDVSPADVTVPLAPIQRVSALWEGTDYFAISKPPGIHSHAGRSAGSVAEQLCSDNPEQAGAGIRALEGGLLHRLDRDTSGVMLAARNRDAYDAGRAAFKAGHVEKHYLAIVEGRPDRRTIRIDTPLVRLHSRVRVARARDRKVAALTYVDLLEHGRGWSLLGVRIVTGVTHQIRVHLASIGHPLLGDLKYGGPPAPPHTRDGHLLHAQRVSLPHGPDVTCGPPADLVRALAYLRRRA